MRASPNGVPLSAGDSSRPLSGLLAAATPLESLLVEMYVLRVEATLLCGRQETLTGVRLAGEVVAVPGLSTGTEDQLFLALRIAAVEDYLGSAVALRRTICSLTLTRSGRLPGLRCWGNWPSGRRCCFTLIIRI